MNEITVENINDILKYYNYFHDGIFKGINYNVIKGEVEVIMHIVSIEDRIVDANIKLLFTGCSDVSIKRIESFDFIEKAYLKFINYKEKESICFAEEINDPLIYIVDDKLFYEEI